MEPTSANNFEQGRFVFCTRCGTRCEAASAFCENCGNPLRKGTAKAALPIGGAPSDAVAGTLPGTGAAVSRKILFGAAAVVSAVAIGAVVFSFASRPPAATPDALLAAARAGYGTAATEAMKRELCLSNTDYSKEIFQAAAWDKRAQDWMAVLVAAGMFQPPVSVQGGGFFRQELLEYQSTPELQKYREGRRLCLAKGVEIAEVTRIGVPAEQAIAGEGSPRILSVTGTLVIRAVDTAPWLESPRVRDAILPLVGSWEYKGQTLQKRVPEWFGLREGKWATVAGYKTELANQYLFGQRQDGKASPRLGAAGSPSLLASLASSLENLLEWPGSHPLKGTWRMAGATLFGMKLPEGLDPDMTFTARSMERGGRSVNAKFEVDGDLVKMTLEGESTSTVFVMESSDVMRIEGTGFRYKRVK